jgi:hypothetical protein
MLLYLKEEVYVSSVEQIFLVPLATPAVEVKETLISNGKTPF